MQQDTINILCATDDNYVPYCGIMLTSVFENNKDVKVDAYVLIDAPLSRTNQRKMQEVANQYKQNIIFLLVDNTIVRNYPTKDMPYWSIAMYYRLYAAGLLPKNIDKILYLDCDIIVNASIVELFKIDMTDRAVAAVDDIFIYTDERQKKLGYPSDAGYFNSGVLLMNLNYWRENNIGDTCINYLINNYDKLTANDQDVLNAVLWDQKIKMPLEYNYQLQFLSHYFFNLQSKELQKEIIEKYKTAKIIHFAHYIKPWSILFYKMPLGEIWYSYKKKTPWANMFRVIPKSKTFNYIIKRFLLWPLGLMKYNSGFMTFDRM